MKVVCKNNDIRLFAEEDEYEFKIHLNILATDKYGIKSDNHLILDKIYDVIDTDNYHITLGFDKPSEKIVLCYLIKNETNLTFWYSCTRFIELDEYRNKKLEEIGI